MLIPVADVAASGRDEASYRDTADRFLQGVQFGAPTAAEHDASWRQHLAGTMLRYQSSGGGAGSGFVQASATAHLCSDGSFHDAGRSSVSATVPGVTALDTDASELFWQWQVSAFGPEQALLIGHDTAGEPHLWVLNDVGHEFHGNGERLPRAPSNACRRRGRSGAACRPSCHPGRARHREAPPVGAMVGHSLGGLLARVYAERSEGDVVGFVFVDASHPEQMERLPTDVVRAVRPGRRLDELNGAGG